MTDADLYDRKVLLIGWCRMTDADLYERKVLLTGGQTNKHVVPRWFILKGLTSILGVAR
jgi:hypothetical protein